MKRTHITLPSLQVAATAFLAVTCQAELYCVDKTTSEVVAAENCEADVGDFTTVDGAPGAALGAVVAKRQNTDDDDDDKGKSKRELEFVAELSAKLAQLKLIAGGFGNGGNCDCSSSSEHSSSSSGSSSSGGGGGGGGAVVYGVGNGGRWSGSRGG